MRVLLTKNLNSLVEFNKQCGLFNKRIAPKHIRSLYYKREYLGFIIATRTEYLKIPVNEIQFGEVLHEKLTISLQVNLYIFKYFLFIFREREREGERETSICGYLSCDPYLGTWPTTKGICLDWESNLPPFGSQAGTQSTEPHQPGHESIFLKEGIKVEMTRESEFSS